MFKNFITTRQDFFVEQSLHSDEMVEIDINGDGRLDLVRTRHDPALDITHELELLLNRGNGKFERVDNWTAAPDLNGAREIVAGDFNRDGKTDLFFAMQGYDLGDAPGWRNALLLSGPNGYFDATSRLPNIADFTHSADAADIDGDGDLDLFVGSFFENDVEGPYLLINDGHANFTLNKSQLPDDLVVARFANWGAYATEVFVDVDRDGDMDLFLPENGSVTRLLLNDGSGTFSEAPNRPPVNPFGEGNATAVDAQLFDFDADGLLDIVIVSTPRSYQGTAIQILRNGGDGTLTDVTSVYLENPPPTGDKWTKYLHFIDLNSDGAVDFLGEPDEGSYVYLNDGTNHFRLLPKGFLDPKIEAPIEPMDVNGDGRMDLVSADNDGNSEPLYVALQQNSNLRRLDGDGDANIILGGKSAQAIFGLGGKDYLFGSAGKDTLDGGAGKDSLLGGLGIDKFVFSGKLSKANADKVLDFQLGKDELALDQDAFAAIGTSLSRAEFHSGAGAIKAHDRSDRIIYDTTSGKLFYDEDGKGGDSAVLFATLANKAIVTIEDFLII